MNISELAFMRPGVTTGSRNVGSVASVSAFMVFVSEQDLLPVFRHTCPLDLQNDNSF